MDALRGIAALLVALLHITFLNRTDSPFERGYLAVDLFFVLSGYVMARTYEPRMAQGFGLLAFAKVRFRRLWPTMAVGAAFGAASMWGDIPLDQAALMFGMALLFIPFFNGMVSVFPQNPPAWSILFELFGNLAHVLVLRFCGMRLLAVIALASAGVLIAWTPSMNIGCWEQGFWFGVPRILFSYTAGIMIWRWRLDRPLLPAWIGLLLLPGAILLAGLVPAAERWPDFVFVFALCPLIVVSGVANPGFGHAAFSFIGAISFPLYAVHFPVAMMAEEAGLGTAATLALVVAVAIGVHLAVNRPGWPWIGRRPVPA